MYYRYVSEDYVYKRNLYKKRKETISMEDRRLVSELKI